MLYYENVLVQGASDSVGDEQTALAGIWTAFAYMTLQQVLLGVPTVEP